MKKKLFIQWVVLGLFALSANVLAADDLPKRVSFARYEPIVKRSPFAVATAVAPPPAMADFARDLFIANAAHSADSDLVTLASTTDTNFKKYLTSKAPVDGYSIANVEWSDRVGETKVTLSKDGQFATLTFNQALLSQPLPRTASVNNPAMNANTRVDQPINRIRPAPVPMLPTPPPRVRGVIPRNPANYNRNPEPPEPIEPTITPPVEEELD